MRANRSPVVVEAFEPRIFLSAAPLADAVISSTLPAAMSDATVVHARVSLRITDNSGTTRKEHVTLKLLANDSSVLATRQATISLANGKSQTFPLSVTLTRGELSDGTYILTGVVTGDADTSVFSAGGPSLVVSAPTVSLSETERFSRLPTTATAGGKFDSLAKVMITNSGNDASTAPLVIGIYATSDGVPADGAVVAAVTKKLFIAPDRSVVVQVPLKTFPVVADGAYKLVAAVTQSNTAVTTSTNPATAPVVTVASAVIVTGGGFTEKIDSVVPQYQYSAVGAYEHLTVLDLLAVIDSTGPSSSGKDTFTLYTSGSATFDSSAVAVEQISQQVTVAKDGAALLNLEFTNPDPGGTATNSFDPYVFVAVTNPAGKTSVAGYATPVEFDGSIF
jgi:hypothetical protein